MNAKAEQNTSSLDVVKWLLVAALVIVGVVGNQYFAAQPILYRAIALVVIGMVAFLLALQTAKGRTMMQLAKEARGEIRRVVWPSRQETVQTTLIVVAVVLVMGLLLWGLDTLIGWIVSIIVG